MAASLLRRWLAHPLTRGADLDDPRTTALRREIIRGKPFLRDIYADWYRALAADIPAGAGRVLELGSGAGFFRDVVPDAICSDVFAVPGNNVVLDAHRLALAGGSLRAIVMIDVLHHLPRAREFFREAARGVRVGGVVAMIEPWVTPWSKLIYTKLHHEPFDPAAASWEFPTNGPLSGANGALPWMIFHRDSERFLQEFPQWRIETARPMMPLRYLLSGGVSMRSLMPGFTTPLWRGIERVLDPLRNQTGMFAYIVLRRVE